MDPIESLKVKQGQIAGDMQAITAAVNAENRAMTEEEDKKFKALDAEYRAVESSIANMERAEELKQRSAQAQARATSVTEVPVTGAQAASTTYQAAAYRPSGPASTGGYGSGAPVAHSFTNHGFAKGVGEFLLKVREAQTTGRVDPRLMVNAVTTWAGESVAADGGYALPPEFVQGIMSLAVPTDSFVRALNPFPTKSDLLTIPKDEDAPWSTTGVQAAKGSEGSVASASKIAVGATKVVMYPIKSLVHVDEKSLRDMSFLSAYVTRKMGEKIRWKVENYIVNGTGENEALGILNAPGLVAISASDGTSTATQISAYDLGLMEASALQSPGGFWIGHPLIKAQLRTLSIGTVPVMQSDFRTGQAVDMLLGYPYFSSEACKAPNTQGDLVFVKPDGYFLAFEEGGVQNATTIAFAFDQNLQSFRSTLYMGGAPSLSAKVLRADGTNYASNLIALAGGRS